MATQTLKFLGRGSAFNIEEGNTSAFLRVKDELLLIDCGEDVFTKLLRLKVLDDIRSITIIITHLHSDHVGSLSSFLYYCKYVLNITPSIFIGDGIRKDFITYLTIQGNLPDDYIINVSATNGVPNLHKIIFGGNVMRITFFEVEHIVKNPMFISYGVSFNFKNDIDGKWILYSGDCVRLPDNILEMFNNGWIDELYMDTCGNKETDCHHILGSIDFWPNRKNRIFAMHLDNIPHQEILDHGINIVSLYKGE